MDLYTEKMYGVRSLMDGHNYEMAKQALMDYLGDNPDEQRLDALTLLGRCQLALEQFEDALYSYQQVADQNNPVYLFSQAEAALVLGQTELAYDFFESVQDVSQNIDYHVLRAVTEYKLGFVRHCMALLNKVIQIGYEWEDEDPVDQVIRQVLPIDEYHDFEHIYLDLVEKDKGSAQNRWLYITAPIYEIFQASSEDQQNRRILKVIRTLSPSFNKNFIDAGRQKLETIIRDFSESKTDSTFGSKTLQALNDEKWQDTAQLILAVMLEHLKQFSNVFGMSPRNVAASQLRSLVPLLPLHIATSVMLVFFQSDPRNKIHKDISLTPNANQVCAVLAAGFIAFYQQIDRYSNTRRTPS